MNNLFPAAITANRSKRARTSQSARADWGRTCAPLSKVAQEKASERNAWKGAAAGALIGLRFGLVGAFWGGVIGLVIGVNASIE
jgi:hypothetical protein